MFLNLFRICVHAVHFEVGAFPPPVPRRHKRDCPVTRADGIIAGLSCKDLSSMNVNKKKHGSVWRQESSPGQSADTMRGFVNYVDNFHPDWGIVENVQTASDENTDDESNSTIFQHFMVERGYEVQSIKISSNYYGVPQRRRRIYFLFVSTSQLAKLRLSDNIDAFFKDYLRLLKAIRRQPPSLQSILLPNDHPAVETELKARQQRKKGATDTGDATASRCDWVDLHLRTFKTWRLRWGSVAPPEEVVQSRWFDMLTPREKECYLFSLLVNKDTLGVDVSQNIDRLRLTGLCEEGERTVIAPACLPRQMLMLHPPYTRLLLGREMLLVQGMPLEPVIEHVEALERKWLNFASACTCESRGTREGGGIRFG